MFLAVRSVYVGVNIWKHYVDVGLALLTSEEKVIVTDLLSRLFSLQSTAKNDAL